MQHVLFVFILQRIYDNIKKEPFKIPEDDGDDLMHTFFNPDKEGWLWKQGRHQKETIYCLSHSQLCCAAKYIPVLTITPSQSFTYIP